jgi:hypothetical protein
MVAAAYQDTSLCKELCNQLNTSLDYSAFHGVKNIQDEDWEPKDVPPNICNPDEEIIAQQMHQLEELLLHIRGSQYKADGSLKMPEDYHIKPEDVEKKRKKKSKELDKPEE